MKEFLRFLASLEDIKDEDYLLFHDAFKLKDTYVEALNRVIKYNFYCYEYYTMLFKEYYNIIKHSATWGDYYVLSINGKDVFSGLDSEKLTTTDARILRYLDEKISNVSS